MSVAREHVPELDYLKGFAIICVVCIHAKLYAETLFHDRVINRAVPIFVVLFGATSELWWKRAASRSPDQPRPLRKWYRHRLERLVIPFWAMAAAWWLAATATGTAEMLGVGWPHALATFAGYAPWIGTTWFVTIILQLVLVFPALRWVVDRLGPWLSLAVFGILCAVCIWHFWDIIGVGLRLLGDPAEASGFYYFWIFSPRMFWHVAVGLVLARLCGARPGKVLTASALALALVGSVLQDVVRGPAEDIFFGPLRQQLVAYLFDVALAVGLLGLFRWVPLPNVVGRALAWCGLFSWGIYLAHLLVHELVHMAGYAPETSGQAVRAAYVVALLASGAALAAAADWLWQRVPMPALAADRAGKAGP
jgi:peptidoglycan/LPS O-acetylase OafA/YrhL